MARLFRAIHSLTELFGTESKVVFTPAPVRSHARAVAVRFTGTNRSVILLSAIDVNMQVTSVEKAALAVPGLSESPNSGEPPIMQTVAQRGVV